MWYVKPFDTSNDLQAFLRAQALAATAVKHVYFDAASGKHVLVYFV